jgi:hypothetical protein
MKTFTTIALILPVLTAVEYVPGSSPPPDPVAVRQQYQTALTGVFQSREVQTMIRAAKPILLTADQAAQCARIYDALDMEVQP